MSELEPLLTTEDVARYLSVEVTTVRRLISRGELGAYKIGGEYRFSSRDVLEYLERQHVPALAAEVRTPARMELVLRRSTPLIRLIKSASTQATFSSFTKRAKYALQLAVGAAQARHDAEIGTEHLLLGLIQERNSLAGSVLALLGVTESRVAVAIDAVVERAERQAERTGDTLNPEAKATLQRAVEITGELGHGFVGTEHLLLALLDQPECAAVRSLTQLGLTVEQVRTTVQVMLDASGRR